MENTDNIKALFIVVNAGFADEVIDLARAAGASGATIINARGEGALHKSFLGITIDSAKEMILSLVDKDTSEKIMASVKEKAGLKSPANGICFTMPVDRITEMARLVHAPSSEPVETEEK